MERIETILAKIPDSGEMCLHDDSVDALADDGTYTDFSVMPDVCNFPIVTIGKDAYDPEIDVELDAALTPEAFYNLLLAKGYRPVSFEGMQSWAATLYPKEEQCYS